VEDRGRICFSRGSLPRFFLRVRDPWVAYPCAKNTNWSLNLYTTITVFISMDV
jgi:hypothetical protein